MERILIRHYLKSTFQQSVVEISFSKMLVEKFKT